MLNDYVDLRFSLIVVYEGVEVSDNLRTIEHLHGGYLVESFELSLLVQI